MLSLRVRTPEPQHVTIRQFPFTIGRSPAADFVLNAAGVWEKHLTIELDYRERRFRFKAEPGAIVFRNRERIDDGWLKNGDTFQIGGSELSVTLSANRQKSLSMAEFGCWILWSMVLIVEASLFALLSRAL
jgi:pSer/pThr/pTyr-binding forkhead associated (FHA) protein